MVSPRYLVFDDMPQAAKLGLTADRIAASLRAPLAAIGVKVVRRHGAPSNSTKAGFQARGFSRGKFLTTFNEVNDIVSRLLDVSVAD
jgi:hypothetical protein